MDTATVSPNLVRSPKPIEVKLGGWGLPYTEYASGRAKSPEISLSDLPAGTKALAVITEDPDALAPKPFVHWLLGDIPVMKTIPMDVKPGELALGGVQGGNTHGTVGYYGPKPPIGDPPHRYHFTVYALDVKLGLKPGFNRVGLLKAMQGHVLGQGTTIARFGK